MRIASRLYLFAVLILGTVTVHADPRGICELLLSGVKVAKPEATFSQAQRLNALLEKMPQDKRQALYATLAKEDLTALARSIRGASLSPQQKALLDANPGLDVALQDLSDFGGIFPGIFALGNADMMIFKVLNIVRTQEVGQNTAKLDLLQSESLVPRLRRTIDNTLINLIEQAEMEYEGTRFERRESFAWFWYKITRWVFPSYKKVKTIIENAQEYEKQLTRLQLVDRLVIKLALADAAELGLTDDEVEKLTLQVLRSPTEIHDIEKQIAKILGQDIKAGQEGEIGKTDIPKAYGVTKEVDWDAQLEKFDQVDLTALELLNGMLNAARARKGMAPRTLQQFDLVELQLRHEAHERRLHFYKDEYLGITAVHANESYTVEDRHEEQVQTGKDKDGNPTYTTRVYYTDRTVHPSFENILSNSFDEGDRNVTGLSAIQDRAHLLYLRELGPRNLIAESHRLVRDVLENYEDAVMKDKDREKYMQSMQAQAEKLQTAMKDQAVYAKWATDQIERQYSKDSYKNFQARNDMMLRRMDNAVKAINELNELMRRRQPQLTPLFDLFDYTQWLGRLRRIRNHNYTEKSILFAIPVAGAVLYNTVPEVQMAMDQWYAHGLQLVQQFIGQ